MATGRVPTTANSPLTAKGDLFTYSTAPARLAVGNDGETLVADSSTSTGLRYQVPVQQNPVLNSAFQVFQRGTSTAVSASTSPYVADRWQANVQASQACTYAQQPTSDTTNLGFIQYCMRVQRNSGQTGTGTINLAQSFETLNSLQLAGKVVTFSFYARKGANYSQAGNGLGAYIYTGTGTDQNVITGYTSGAIPVNASATLTTTWQRFQGSGTIAAGTTEIGVRFQYDPTGTAGANDYFEVTGVQLEVGSVATPFHTYAATIQGELAACQRYYQRISGQSATATDLCTGYLSSTTRAAGVYVFPVPMRVAPTMAVSASADIQVTWSAGTSTTSAYNTDRISPNSILLALTTSGLTTGQGGNIFVASGTTKYLEASAEL
jgi:hypothetical protein